MRIRILSVVALLALHVPSVCQGAVGSSEQQGLGVNDGLGNFYSVTARSGTNAYFQVTKMSLTGVWQWNVPYNPQAGFDVTAQAINIDHEGNLVIAGTRQGEAHQNLLLVKFTKDGSLYWDRVYDNYAAGTDVIPSALATDRDGNIYVASTVASPLGGSIQVVRYNTAGGFFWSREYRGGRSSYARAIVIDRNGDARVTVDTSIDTRNNYYQTREAIFTMDGGVILQ